MGTPDAPTPRPPGGDLYVICVDDDPEFVRSLELFLPDRVNDESPDGATYEFLFFTDPREAIDVLGEIQSGSGLLAMVISDQQMPQMKGTAFLAKVREQSPDSIRVLLTGHAGLDSAITAINERLLDKYMTKPIENDHDFTVSIRHLLQRFRMQRLIEKQQRTIVDLYRFANRLNAIGNLAPMLDHVVGFVSDALDCRRVSLLLLEGNTMVHRAPATGPAEMPPARVAVAPEVIERLFVARGAKRADRQEEIPWLEPGGDGPLPASLPFLYTTLASGERVLGVLIAAEKKSGLAPDKGDEEILTYAADTASVAIHNQLQHVALADAYSETRANAAALAAANDRLHILDRMKSDFLAFVSHELRTPLTALSAIDLLRPSSDVEQQTQVISIVRNGYERLEQFIQEGLEYVGWIAAEHPPLSERVDLAEVVRAAAEELPARSESEIELGVSVPESACRVQGCVAHLTEVVRILLDNAVKFSPREKQIRIGLESQGNRVTLTVTDQGVGFAPGLADELFRPFTIADSDHHGRGFALSLAKAAAIVKAHGGEIHASSDGVGRGASFRVELPLAAAEGPSAPRSKAGARRRA